MGVRSQANAATWLISQGFTNVQTDGHWSSTTFSNLVSAFMLYMNAGLMHDYPKDYSFYVWPLRGTSSGTAQVWKTGETSCYDASGNVVACAATGQDGEIQAGVAWPNPRFTDNGDQTITDNLTGLMWTKDAGTPTSGACTGSAKTWQDAFDYVRCLNNSSYLGHNDWRLPNKRELLSLINFGEVNSAAWLNGQGFRNVEAYNWTSTTYASYPSAAWDARMSPFVGFMEGLTKPANAYVWPVRGGTLTADTTPDPFTFTDQTGVALSTLRSDVKFGHQSPSCS